MKDADDREFQHTFQLRAYTSKQGFAELEKVLRQQCWLYNQALEMRIKAWEIGGVSVSFYDQCKWLTGMRFTHQFTTYDRMDTLARRVQCGTLKRLDKSFDAFFRRVKAGHKAGFPRFKPAQRWHTIEVGLSEIREGLAFLLPGPGQTARDPYRKRLAGVGNENDQSAVPAVSRIGWREKMD